MLIFLLPVLSRGGAQIAVPASLSLTEELTTLIIQVQFTCHDGRKTKECA